MKKENKTMKRIFSLGITAAITVFLFTACFSQFTTLDNTTLTLSLGSSSQRAIVSEQDLNRMEYTVILTGPMGEEKVINVEAGQDSVSITVEAGHWEIKAHAWLDDKENPFGEGSASLEVIAGQNNPVIIEMTIIEYVIDDPHEAIFTITFAQIADVNLSEIIGPVISLSGTPTSDPPSRVTIEVTAGNYTSVEWFVDGAVGDGTTGSGITFILDAANPAYNGMGDHSLTVEVIVDGAWYNKTVTFTVAP